MIGSAGSDDKVDYLINTIGIDAAFNYKTQNTREQLSKIAKDGLDIYFDLVGGKVFDIALEKLKPHGQIMTLGNMAESSAKVPYTIKNMALLIRKSASIHGLSAFHHLNKFSLLWEKF